MRELYATIDLGSNSFHMLVAALEHDEIKILESTSEKVMLAEGLSKQNGIHPDARRRALECISRFAQRIENIPNKNIRIVGTNTLRAAANTEDFITELEARLKQVPIEIVSGIEEARLIYLGVNHSWSSISQRTRNLVVDIGGGSTEFIVGKNFKLKEVESLRMGCVAFRRYFPNDEISSKYFNRAAKAARYELANIEKDFNPKSWDYSVGSAGTFKQIERLLVQLGLSDEGIQLKALEALKKRLLSYEKMEQLSELGLKPARTLTIVPGVAIALAIFKALKIKTLHIARGGLREGILYDLLGRLKKEDIRERSISAISQRYHVNRARSDLLRRIAKKLAGQLNKGNKRVLEPEMLRLLEWSAHCSYIGLSINHSQYQGHSAYLLRNSELSGFSLNERKILAAIVENQRRKLNLEQLDQIHMTRGYRHQIYQIIFLLRLSIIIGLNGKTNRCQDLQLKFSGTELMIRTTEKWLEKRPLIKHAFYLEQAYWRRAGFVLQIADDAKE